MTSVYATGLTTKEIELIIIALAELILVGKYPEDAAYLIKRLTETLHND